MPAANKFNDYVNQSNRAKHDWSSHAFKLALTNTLPLATNSILSDITQIAAGNGYVAGGNALSGVTLAMAGGVLTVSAAQVVFTATGTVASFRYYVLYNDTQTTPVKPLVMWWDHGSVVTLQNAGDTFTAQFNGANPGTIFTDS